MMKLQDIGLIGLAVMGQNLVLNMERNGFGVGVYNRTESTTTAFIEGPASGKNITATYTLNDLLASLKKPHVVTIMVKAGAPVDEVIAQLKPFLESGDLIIDGGNSHFRDTERRSKEMEAKGIRYMGVGISGGEEGALWGPSIMPGGPREAYDLVEPILKSIAAKVNNDPCVTYIGPRGSGHFVKMVHNAIEYGDMQLIAEAYDILHRGLGLSEVELHEVFARWNKGPLSSYLIEITANIFTYIDNKTKRPLVDMILDQAEQKGTGRWTIQAALELDVPIPTIHAAVEARILSTYKLERMETAKFFPIPVSTYRGDRDTFVNAVGDALYVSKICSYAQGMALLRRASEEYHYNLDYSEIARIWRGGCIIRARFLDDVRVAFKENPNLSNLLIAPFFHEEVLSRHTALRHVVETSIELGIPAPGMSASLAYFDSYRSGRLPANLIQAQRDYFGAHTYRRVDQEGIFHTKWTG
ncbi:MAG: NADP-dependent phosphogluconate dehydrogenase [Desulfobacterales bacterium]|nr:NADP-dependent phosphogluconate dehydrogenase [Desulfobacterales bacterium]